MYADQYTRWKAVTLLRHWPRVITFPRRNALPSAYYMHMVSLTRVKVRYRDLS